jgi:hypothetical protein
VSLLLGDEAPSLWYVLALLNSRLLDFVFRRGAAQHANGYYAANRQFIAPLPIRIGGAAEVGALESLARRLTDHHGAVVAEREGFTDWLSGEFSARRLPALFESYERHDLERLLDVLRQQRRHFGADPSTRAFRERLTRELTASRDRLTDHLQEIEHLERSTDGAVYDLYELSTAERALVDAEYESPTGVSG